MPMVNVIQNFVWAYRYWRSGVDAFTGQRHTHCEALLYAWRSCLD